MAIHKLKIFSCRGSRYLAEKIAANFGVNIGNSQVLECHQLGSYRDAGPVLTVLTSPSEIGHDGNHPVSRRTVGRINHQQQLHQIVRRRESRLYDKDGAPANTFVVGRLKLSVAELQDL